MGSVLERPQLNKIFLIYGHLDDMFISRNLQKNNFRPFLNGYLKNLGYEQIVFYSGAKNVGKFVLDDESAILAINKNKGLRQASSSNTEQKPAEKKRRRIMNPRAGATTAEASSQPEPPKTQESNTTTQVQNDNKDVKLT